MKNKYPKFERIPEKEFRKIIKRIKNYFNQNKNTFLNNSISYEDLEQEILLKITETLRKYGDKKGKDLFKLMNLAIGWKLKDLLGISIKNSDVICYRIEDFNNFFVDIKKESDYLIKLFNLLTNKEYNVLHKRIVENKTFKEIGKELNLTKQRVNQIFLGIVKKIKKKL